MADLPASANLRESSNRQPGLRKRGQGIRSWIRVDTSENSEIIEVDKFTMIEKAIVMNLEQIRCIITAEEVLILNSLDRESDFGGSSPDYLPFEFRALEVALESTCTFLDCQVNELTSKISALNLERVRRLKSRLLALTRRVQKGRDEIEQLMDDDGDMAEMYLTKKKIRMESSFYGDQSIDGASISSLVPPTSLSIARSRHESKRSSESNTESIKELEMLLEAYFVVIDSSLNKLITLKEYIDDTELIQFDLLVTAATFAVAIFGLVDGIFGMNFEIPMFKDLDAFKWVLLITGATGIIIFCSFLWFFKHRRLMLMPL
ncbi:hypothetical protein UlMin_017838 [Ulmus minor]